MPSLARIDWVESSASERLEALRRATGRQVCAMARAVEWEGDCHEVIGWISAQICVDLGSALTLFMNAGPESYNRIPRNHVTGGAQSTCAQLDVLCQRINAGFYLPDPTRQMIGAERLVAWMDAQAEDNRLGQAGRWQLNPVIVAPMMPGSGHKGRRRPKTRNKGFLGKLISPLFA
ncbi:MAG: hypothetical protein GYB53_06605 [Rhodobacteraceae bacterium]|nr:hypothetical protein [Paracoccaceae bacterium]MBR9822381.1 hypothetical protein [Paracoccaceae bacterium]